MPLSGYCSLIINITNQEAHCVDDVDSNLVSPDTKSAGIVRCLGNPLKTNERRECQDTTLECNMYLPHHNTNPLVPQFTSIIYDIVNLSISKDFRASFEMSTFAEMELFYL